LGKKFKKILTAATAAIIIKDGFLLPQE